MSRHQTNKEREAIIKKIAETTHYSYDDARYEFDRLQTMFPYSPLDMIEKLTVLTIECRTIKGIR